MRLPRSSGIFLHPTSLPGGRLGDDAYRFVDWLESAGQSWWQVLPLGPPDEFGSPYRTTSAFAGSPALLADPQARVTTDEVEDFVARHSYWSAEWARFAGARAEGPTRKQAGGEITDRVPRPDLGARAEGPTRKQAGGEITDHVPRPDRAAGALADQVRFEREWTALRAYGREHGVRLIGDVPIYVSNVGMDVESWPELFAHGDVAGAPPDALSANGQRWGNPLYDWHVHHTTGYRWWIERFRRVFELVDVSRVDHFRGFVSYWAIPERHKTARNGTWMRGPGAALFHAVEGVLGDLPLIAEDLGVITPPVRRLRDELGLPGMAVLLWAFGSSPSNPHALRNHRENLAVYTSTHDTDTVVGWFASLGKRQRVATGLDPAEPHWGLIELAYSSPASLAVVTAQDVLGLGSEARMNRPGKVEGNWSWRLQRGELTDELAARVREAAVRHQR